MSPILDLAPTHDHFTRFQRRLGAMNPDTKLILEELQKQFAEQDDKLERHFGDLEAKWEKKFDDADDTTESRLVTLEKVAAAYEEWQPGIEGTMDDLKLEVRKLNKHWERAVRDNAPVLPGLCPLPESASARPPAGVTADGPNGHRVDIYNREDGYGSVTTLLYPPVKGTCLLPPPVPRNSFSSPHQQSRSRGSSVSLGGSGSGKIPKLNFPVFDGDSLSFG